MMMMISILDRKKVHIIEALNAIFFAILGPYTEAPTSQKSEVNFESQLLPSFNNMKQTAKTEIPISENADTYLIFHDI